MKRTKKYLSILFINFIVFIFVVFDLMTKYLVFFLKYYPNCVSILYKKCCRVVFLTKRTLLTIVFFFANVSDFVLCPRVTFFPFFTNVQCYIIKKLTDLNRSGSTGKYPTSVLLYWPRYRSVNTARPRLDIFPYCPHSQSVSYYYLIFLRSILLLDITPVYVLTFLQ
jgi:hypothetical protein